MIISSFFRFGVMVMVLARDRARLLGVPGSGKVIGGGRLWRVVPPDQATTPPG